MKEDIELVRIERAIIGNLLYDPTLIYDVADIISPSMFHGDNAEIYKLIYERHENNKPFDITIISDIYRDVDIVMEYLNDIKAEFHIQYCHELKENYLKNQFIDLVSDYAVKVQNDNATFDQLMVDFENKILGLNENIIKEDDPHISNPIRERLESVDKEKKEGILTGIPIIDKYIGGVHKNDFLEIAGKPGNGKTSLALQIAFNIAMQGIPVGIASLEMNKKSLVEVIVSIRTGIPRSEIRNARLNVKQKKKVLDALHFISELPIYLNSGTSKLNKLKSITRKWKIKYGIKVMIYDYIQIMTVDGSEGRYDALSTASRSLKSLFSEADADIAGIVLAQLTKGKGRPTLDSLKGSSSLEDDPDEILFIYGKEDSDMNDGEKSKRKISLAKNRAGEVGMEHEYEFKYNKFTYLDNLKEVILSTGQEDDEDDLSDIPF